MLTHRSRPKLLLIVGSMSPRIDAQQPAIAVDGVGSAVMCYATVLLCGANVENTLALSAGAQSHRMPVVTHLIEFK